MAAITRFYADRAAAVITCVDARPLAWAAIGVGTAVGGATILYFRAELSRRRREALAHARAEKAGHSEPATLHPRIDEHKCICTGACVEVCPEKDVLGMIDGRPKLINPSACIGHGECLRACPVDAITLVIGSEKRGVDLPLLAGDFQTNVPGLYIAGELGGMGLIHNAVNQGTQAVRAIARSLGDGGAKAGAGPAATGMVDLLVVGAGPAGLAAALCARSLGLSCAVLEREQPGGTVRSFPRQKIVMTAPVDLPIYGKVKLRRTTKEALLELWDEVMAKTGITVDSGVTVNEIKRQPEGHFLVETSAGSRTARRVLLAIGRRGAPRKLGVPGEHLDKVTYKLIEPEQYRGTRCAVFGGGDSAVETAMMLAAEPGTQVTLVHRGERFDRIKPANREALEAAQAQGKLVVKTQVKPLEITAESVRLDEPEGGGGPRSIDNDFVFVCIGGELPSAWLAKIGIEVRTFRGEAHPAAQA